LVEIGVYFGIVLCYIVSSCAEGQDIPRTQENNRFQRDKADKEQYFAGYAAKQRWFCQRAGYKVWFRWFLNITGHCAPALSKSLTIYIINAVYTFYTVYAVYNVFIINTAYISYII
jgi:hypothetical protein